MLDVSSVGEEIPVVFQCHESKMLGVVHLPQQASTMGVLLVVGGPQYRVGSHRQFVLLARALAKHGTPVLRFDYRGMGDAEDEIRTFDIVDEDISAAISCFYQTCPELTGIVIWGLCDAASAALFYAYQDERVKGLVLLNPWAFTEQGAAKTYLKHYYWQRLTNPELWRKILSFKFNYKRSLFALVNLIKKTVGDQTSFEQKTSAASKTVLVDNTLALPIRMRECLSRFQYPVLLILSGRDLTAEEFKGVVNADESWQALLAKENVTRHDLKEADHTFSSALWRNQVEEWTVAWVQNLSS
jgi:exosortase A-associated hydrolase 1